MSREEHGNRTTWRMRTRDIASALMGARDTARMVTTLLHKRDLGAVWEVDPVAAPPRYVQQRILGTPEAPDRPVALLPRPDDERHVGADPASFEERRSVLELQLRFAMERRDVERSRQISRELRGLLLPCVFPLVSVFILELLDDFRLSGEVWHFPGDFAFRGLYNMSIKVLFERF